MSDLIAGLDLTRRAHRKLALIRLVRSGVGVYEAAAMIPVARNTVYKYRASDPDFARRLDEAKTAPRRRLQQRFLDQVAAGHTYHAACRRSGTSTGTASRWINTDEWVRREYYRCVGPTGRKPDALPVLLSALRRGETMIDACRQAGYDPSTPYTWRRRRRDVWQRVQAAREAGRRRRAA